MKHLAGTLTTAVLVILIVIFGIINIHQHHSLLRYQLPGSVVEIERGQNPNQVNDPNSSISYLVFSKKSNEVVGVANKSQAKKVLKSKKLMNQLYHQTPAIYQVKDIHHHQSFDIVNNPGENNGQNNKQVSFQMNNVKIKKGKFNGKVVTDNGQPAPQGLKINVQKVKVGK